jgi:type I restriction-modification system DNA methylase subunit
MARAKKASNDLSQECLIIDTKRDINPYWRSSLFSEVYLKNDVPREYKHLWENDEIGGFYDFYQGFVDLCVETKHECFEKWKEADTVKNWIVHVMDLLGWENNSERRTNSYMDNESFTVEENNRKQTFRPDLVYFDKPKHKSYTQKEKDIHKKLTEAKDNRTGTKIVVEAKYWDRLSHLGESSSKDTKVNDSASALGPELQTLKYMEIFDHDFGILTDGKTWRLFHKELSQGMDRRSYDFDLGNLREVALELSRFGNEEKFRFYAKYFYYFFSKESLIQSDKSKTVPFVFEVFDYSKKYATSIEEDLKKRFVITMGTACNAFRSSCEELGEELDLELIRNVSESHLFNILFVKSCEVRKILPIHSTQYLRLSLHEIIETLDAMNFDPDKDWDEYLRDFRYTFGKDFDWDGFEIHNRFINLYEIIHDGTAKSKDFGFEIEGFKESIFSKDEWRFAKKHKINNKKMVEILFCLTFIESSFKGRKFQQIPYSYFTARQLGSIYESLLEFKLERASTDMIFKKGQWSEANLKSKVVKGLRLAGTHVVEKGDLFFSPDNEDRKVTGSYYTPDYIVRNMVKESLGQIVESKTTREILKLKVCDPAMGSGHFLAGALDYLVDLYRRKWSEENNDDMNESVEETSRKILDCCLYGVDINPRAVKLASMSLWLTTAFPGKKLERLDDQLCIFNSLDSSNWLKGFGKIKFDIIIGNPPYGDYFSKEERLQLSSKFDFFNAKCDMFILFLESAYRKIPRTEDSIASFIVPNSIMFLEAYKEYRKYILENFNNISFNQMTYQVFDDANVDTCIVSVGNNKEIFELRKIDNADDFTKVLYEKLNRKEVLKDELLRIRIESKSPLDNFKNTVGDYFDVIQGAKAYEVGKGKPPQTRKMLEDRIYSSLKKKGKEYRKFLYGRDIKQFRMVWVKKEYIKYGGNLAAPRKSHFHEGERVVTQLIRNPKLEKRIIATFLSDDSISSVGLNIFKLKKSDLVEKKVSYKALCVYLSLPSVNEWYKSVNIDVNIKATILRTIPIDISLIEKSGVLDSHYQSLVKVAENEKNLNTLLKTIDSQVFSKPKSKKIAA